MNLDTDLTIFIKISSKWIIDLMVKCKSMKHLEIIGNIVDCGYGDEFLYIAPSSKESYHQGKK